MDLRDEEIAKKLDETLRKPLEASEISEEVDLDVHDSPCFHFLCENDPNYLRVKQLVRSLSWELERAQYSSWCLALVDSGRSKAKYSVCSWRQFEEACLSHTCAGIPE